MSDDEKESGDSEFLSRWSRRKQEAREQPPAAQPVVAADAPVPALPPVNELTLESDFSGFMHPKVDDNLRRAALKKLFSDPHFNIMDGLDTYIDDYSQPNPIPPAMLAGLRQAQNILAWAKETKEETAARFAPPPAENSALPPTEQSTLPADEIAPPSEVVPAANAQPTAAQPAADAAAERKS